jgi:hypothetical protein
MRLFRVEGRLTNYDGIDDMLDLSDLPYARSLDELPTEDQEQAWLIQWIKRHAPPEARRLFHVPNGGGRSKSQGATLKLLGVQPGVPDLFLPVVRPPYHGLWIEMKSLSPQARASAEQRDWLLYLDGQGYKTALCAGFEAARDVILAYLNPPTLYNPGII